MQWGRPGSGGSRRGEQRGLLGVTPVSADVITLLPVSFKKYQNLFMEAEKENNIIAYLRVDSIARNNWGEAEWAPGAGTARL